MHLLAVFKKLNICVVIKWILLNNVSLNEGPEIRASSENLTHLQLSLSLTQQSALLVLVDMHIDLSQTYFSFY